MKEELYIPPQSIQMPHPRQRTPPTNHTLLPPEPPHIRLRPNRLSRNHQIHTRQLRRPEQALLPRTLLMRHCYHGAELHSSASNRPSYPIKDTEIQKKECRNYSPPTSHSPPPSLAPPPHPSPSSSLQNPTSPKPPTAASPAGTPPPPESIKQPPSSYLSPFDQVHWEGQNSRYTNGDSGAGRGGPREEEECRGRDGVSR